jgi:hypothetical protein
MRRLTETQREEQTLEKLKDDSNLSDHARKVRDKKLKLAATKQRLEMATQRRER